jgi:hypothetical protein
MTGRMHHKALWPLTKKANRGFRGYPVATVAFYGPDDRRASKVAVALLRTEGAEPADLERWFSDDHDVRDDADIQAAIQNFIETRGAKTVIVADRIIGCPHERAPIIRKVRNARTARSGQRATGGRAMCCIDDPAN